MSTYAWLVHTDRISDHDETTDTYKPVAREVCGPRSATDEQLAKLKAGEGHEFQMFDDDGNLYYEGRFLGDKDAEEAFGPLDDYGGPNAGCTEIKYRNAAGEWETL